MSSHELLLRPVEPLHLAVGRNIQIPPNIQSLLHQPMPASETVTMKRLLLMFAVLMAGCYKIEEGPRTTATVQVTALDYKPEHYQHYTTRDEDGDIHYRRRRIPDEYSVRIQWVGEVYHWEESSEAGVAKMAWQRGRVGHIMMVDYAHLWRVSDDGKREYAGVKVLDIYPVPSGPVER